MAAVAVTAAATGPLNYVERQPVLEQTQFLAKTGLFGSESFQAYKLFVGKKAVLPVILMPLYLHLGDL